MSSLHGGPSLTLTLLFLWSVGALISYSRRINEDFRPCKRHHPRPFRVPLIPAHLHTETSYAGIYRLKSEVTRSEIEFLIVSRVVRNVHLAIFSSDRAILFYHHSSVVIESRSTSFKERSHNDDAQCLCQFSIESG